MNILRLLLPYLMSRSVKGGLSNALLQGLLMRGLRRNPIGFVGMFLLQKALAGDGRLFGMDLASRRKARLAWLVGLLPPHGLFSGRPAKSAHVAKFAARLMRSGRNL